MRGLFGYSRSPVKAKAKIDYLTRFLSSLLLTSFTALILFLSTRLLQKRQNEPLELQPTVRRSRLSISVLTRLKQKKDDEREEGKEGERFVDKVCVQLNIDERVTSQRQQALFIRCKKMSSWICILLYTRSEDITIIIIIIIVWRKTNKVVVSSLVSAFFPVFFSSHLLCAFIHKRKQTGKEIQQNRRRRQNNFDRFSLPLPVSFYSYDWWCFLRWARKGKRDLLDESRLFALFYSPPYIFRSYADEWTRSFVFSLPVNYYWYPRKIMRKKNVEDLCHYNDFLFPLYRDRMHRWMTEHLVLRRFREDEITRSSKKKKDYSFDNQHQLGDNIDHLFIIFVGCIFLSVCLSLSCSYILEKYDALLFLETTNRKHVILKEFVRLRHSMRTHIYTSNSFPFIFFFSRNLAVSIFHIVPSFRFFLLRCSTRTRLEADVSITRL